MKNVCYINAGAGAGKTFQLTSELTKCFAEEGVQPSEVILTTFTELAAGEFKEKARNAILTDKRLDNDPQRRMQLCVELDSATIGTVHSVAFDFIKRFWYLLDYGAEMKPMSDNYESIYMNQSLTDMISKADFESLNTFSEHFLQRESEEELHAWQKDLRDLVQKMTYYDVTAIEESLEKSVDKVKAVFVGPKWTDDATERYRRLLEKFRAQRQKDYEVALQKPEKKGAPAALEDIKCIDNNPDFAYNYNHYRALKNILGANQKKTFQKKLAIGEQADWAQYDDYVNSESYVKEIEAYITCLFNIAKKWKENFERYKKENHIISFNDMELLFVKLLEREEVQQEIRQRYKVLMVDEFQDSNPIQLKIFNLLSELIAENGGKSIWVGDAKQAIYGFRGTDTELVNGITRRFPLPGKPKEIVRDEVTGLSSSLLNTSWRSREPLVTLVNRVFEKIFEKEIPNKHLIKLNSQFGNDLEEPAIRHWLITRQSKENVDDGLAYKVEELLKSGLQVKQKKRELPTRTLTYKDIAILAAKNDDVAEIAKALRKRGIPVSTTEQNILQRKEIKLAMTLLEYFLEPYNKHLRADLAYLLDNVTTEELLTSRLKYVKELGEEEKDEWMGDADFLPMLNLLKARMERLSLSEIVTAVVYELNLPALVGKWGEENIRRQNLNSLIEMAKNFDDSCVAMGIGATITGFLNYMRSNQVESAADNTSDTVKVMTYHKSKGLEWPVVILTSLTKEVDETNDLIKKNFMGVHEMTMGNEGDDLFNRQYYIHYFPRLYPGNTNVPILVQEKIKGCAEYDIIHQREVSEQKRVLYVGMTRARDYLISVGYAERKKDGVTLKPLQWLIDVGIAPQPEEKVTNLWCVPEVNVVVENLEVVDVPAPEMGQAASFLSLDKPKERTDFAPKYLSPSKLEIDNDDHTEMKVVPENIGQGIPRGTWKDMAAVGTCIHNIFAVYNPQQAGNEERAHRVIAHAGMVNELDAVATTIVESAAQLYEYLTRTYGAATAIYKELPFYHEVDGQILHGEMDLVWEYETEGEHHCVLIDYKTFPGKASELLAHTRQYVPQLRAYHAALTAGGKKVDAILIYYAVQGKMVAVEI